ncbi:hypothetical protein [Mesorhizobium sp. A556]
MSARDVIARTIQTYLRHDNPTFSGTNLFAHGVLEALTTAGYRILGPDELDPVTVERCAAIAIEQANADLGLKLLAREDKDGHGAMIHAAEEAAARSIAISFRSLVPEAPHE